MPNRIERLSGTNGPFIATNSTGTTARVGFGSAAGGVLIVTAVSSTPATITWHVAATPDGTLSPLRDGSGSAVTTTVDSANSYLNAYPLPDALFAAPCIAAVTNAGSVTFTIAVKG